MSGLLLPADIANSIDFFADETLGYVGDDLFDDTVHLVGGSEREPLDDAPRDIVHHRVGDDWRRSVGAKANRRRPGSPCSAAKRALNASAMMLRPRPLSDGGTGTIAGPGASVGVTSAGSIDGGATMGGGGTAATGSCTGKSIAGAGRALKIIGDGGASNVATGDA
jgi:hypothetical protein